MPGEAACTGWRGAGQARRARHPACAGSARGSQNWGAPGRRAGGRPHRSTGRSGRGGGSNVVAVDLAAIRDLGHAHGGTVNDVVLAAVAGALRTLLAARGEQLGEVTITVPVAARRAATGGELGNHIGIMPVTVPATGNFGTRVTRTAAITRERKSGARGASATLFVPAFLLLARTGLLRWFARHQRVVHTFVTNLRGPDDLLTFGGAMVRAIIPIPSTTGNVTATFAAASYAGTLRITILSDPARMPDAPALAAALCHELSAPADRPPP